MSAAAWLLLVCCCSALAVDGTTAASSIAGRENSVRQTSSPQGVWPPYGYTTTPVASRTAACQCQGREQDGMCCSSCQSHVTLPLGPSPSPRPPMSGTVHCSVMEWCLCLAISKCREYCGGDIGAPSYGYSMDGCCLCSGHHQCGVTGNAVDGEGSLDRASSQLAPLFWQHSVIYQVYPRSLQDSDGDGGGDLAGIKSRLSYFVDIGVGVIWLSPIFKSPMADFGYDISNFTQIDPIFGTLEDFDALIAEAHSLGMKLVMDLVPNHTSDEHEWFQKSIQRQYPYTDYYVWAPPKTYLETGEAIPPNNWLCKFNGGSAWTWNEERKEFYYHQYLMKQPDLNYRNPLVQLEMESVISFWMDRGVDGVRVDAISHLFEAEDISQDEPPSGNSATSDPTKYHNLNHTLTSHQPETFQVLRRWRQLLDRYKDSKVLMAETVYDINNMATVMQYYGSKEEPISHFPFNFNFLTMFRNRAGVTGLTLKDSINKWMNNLPQGTWPNWLTGNHDHSRLASRVGSDLTDAFAMIVLLLPGTAITYYGEEIGMEDTVISFEDTRDPAGCNWGPDQYSDHSRDPARTPMQWDNTPFAGFSAGSDTWLPVNNNHQALNAEAQGSAPQSPLKVYRSLTRLRTKEVFRSGGLSFPAVTEQVCSFARYTADEMYLVVVNTAVHAVLADLVHHSGGDGDSNIELPEMAEIVIRSSTDARDITEPRTLLDLSSVPLLGGEGLVLRAPRGGRSP